MHSQRGAAIIEFALVLPILMFLLVGLIEIGRVAYFNIEVANAAHAGAQYGAFGYPSANSTNMSVAAGKDGQNSVSSLVSSGSYVCSCWNPATGTESPATPTQSACGLPCATGGHSVTYAQVTVQGTINALFNYSALGLPRQWTVTHVATIRVVQTQ
jgi:Flp pilus assembly protein TadG